jgi:hypothetical protein
VRFPASDDAVWAKGVTRQFNHQREASPTRMQRHLLSVTQHADRPASSRTSEVVSSGAWWVIRSAEAGVGPVQHASFKKCRI